MSEYTVEFYTELKRISYSLEELEKRSSGLDLIKKEIIEINSEIKDYKKFSYRDFEKGYKKLAQIVEHFENARNDEKIKSENFLNHLKDERRKIQNSIFWFPVVFFGFYKVLDSFNFI
jgi:hypothetical protein